MIDILIGTAIGSIGAAIAYKLGKKRASDTLEGCNGHHWGEAKPFISRQRIRGADIDSIPACHLEYIHANTCSNKVSLTVDAIKSCQDCGKMKKTTVHVGEVSYDEIVD